MICSLFCNFIVLILGKNLNPKNKKNEKVTFVSLFFSSFFFAQNDVEEMRNEDQLLLSENGRNSFRLEIKQPFTLNKVYTCKKSDFNTQFVKAEFPGGEDVFVKQLKNTQMPI